ncbi:MAG: rRNA (guanine527-N7)-methyltransferase [Thermoleophilaceae bacterium]|nr:rRNA (guanine527-N7)-methyltransferase [Thermoleophilaceae bacterium]
MSPVSRETAGVPLRAALDRHGQPAELEQPLARLLAALLDEPDPHTTVSEPDAAAEVHVADSLVALRVPELRDAESVADVGAGAGFPGLVLAAALPSARVDLLEASKRKAALIGRLAQASGIANARAVHARAEEWAVGDGREAYDAVTVRAVGPLAVLVEYAAPLLRVGGVLVAWKGQRDHVEETGGAAAAGQLGFDTPEVVAVEPYPGSRNRHLHLYRKVSATPERYPRRPGMAAKRPLG